MAIQGDGYFVMSGGKQNFFSRDGAFDLGRHGWTVKGQPAADAPESSMRGCIGSPS